MSSYTLHNDAKIAINNIIAEKEREIETIESDISRLKKVRRMMNEKFNEEVGKTDNYIG